jgi:hypothetical protein
MATILFFLGFLAVVAVAVVIARRSGDRPRRMGGGWGASGAHSGVWDNPSSDYSDGGGSSWGGDGGGWSGGGDGGGGGGGN